MKDAIRNPLLAAAIANAAVFWVAMSGNAIAAGQWGNLLREMAVILPAGALAVLVSLANAQFDDLAKARLVFWRWHNPYPGSRAFTGLGTTDYRVDLDAIAKKHGPLPMSAADQNRLWYRLYKTVEHDASVLHVHRQFLFTRDLACITALLAVTLGPAGFVFMPPKQAGLYLLFLAIEFLLASRAARVHGTRFVTTVLALKGAGK